MVNESYVSQWTQLKEHKNQSTYIIHPDSSQDPHSVTKFGAKIEHYWKISDENPWRKFGEIYDCWARMVLVSEWWTWSKNNYKNALPIERISDYQVLVLLVVVFIFFRRPSIQKHLWRIVVYSQEVRGFPGFRCSLRGVYRTCIQTELVATDRLGLLPKCGQQVSTFASTMYWRRVQLHSRNRFWEFQDFLIRVWPVNQCGRDLQNSSQTQQDLILSLSSVVSLIHSSPYRTWFFKIESYWIKTTDFPVAWACPRKLSTYDMSLLPRPIC